MGRDDAARQTLGRSMAILEQHLSMNPDDSRALCFGAVNLAEMGERERAIEWTERALDAAGGEAFIQYNSACTYAVLGESGDRKSFVSGKSVSVRVDLGGRSIINKKNTKLQMQILNRLIMIYESIEHAEN